MEIFQLGNITLVHAPLAHSLLEWQGQINLIFCYPPYNIGSLREKKLGARKHGGFDPKSYGAVRSYADNLSEVRYNNQQRKFLSLWVPKHLATNGVLVYNHKNRYKNNILISPRDHFPQNGEMLQFDEIIWDRGSTHNHGNCRTYQQTEYLYAFRKPGQSYYFKNHPIKNGHRGCGNVWYFSPEFRRKVRYDCVMPLELAKHVIRCFSREGDLVCDPYLGSGTTAIACYQLGRRFVGCDRSARAFKEAKLRLLEAEQEFRRAA